MEVRKFQIFNCKTNKMLENQKALQKYTKIKNVEIETLLEMYNTAIFVECGEAINETSFKWWKTPDVNIAALKEELADIYIFALDLSLLADKEEDIKKTLESTWVKVEEFEKDFTIMINRLKLISSKKYMNIYNSTYGIVVMRAIIDIAVLYGYTDIEDVVIAKQLKNIKRQENGYNIRLECATE